MSIFKTERWDSYIVKRHLARYAVRSITNQINAGDFEMGKTDYIYLKGGDWPTSKTHSEKDANTMLINKRIPSRRKNERRMTVKLIR